MAELMAQSSLRSIVVGVEDGELHIRRNREGRCMIRTISVRAGVCSCRGSNTCTSSLSDFARNLQPPLLGTKWESTGDCRPRNNGRLLSSIAYAAAVLNSPVRRTSARATVSSSEGIIEETTLPTCIQSEELIEASGHEFVSASSYESGKVPLLGELGPTKIVDHSIPWRSQLVPEYVTPKKRGKGADKKTIIDRWTRPGSKAHQVTQLLDTLKNVHPSDEGVQAALVGWESSLSTRDIISVIAGLDWKVALPFFKWLQSEGYELNVLAYNVLLGTLRSGRVWKLANDFAEQMISEGIQPDNYTYSTLISCAFQCNCSADALKWYERMHETGCIPDEVTYSNMALVYSRLGRVEDAVELYERLRATGWTPDKISFGTMVNVYSRAGNYMKASGLIREMNEVGLHPEAVVYNTLIKCFSRDGKITQAKRVFADMEKAGVKPTEYTLSLMIEVHGRVGETKEAFQLFTRMKEEKLPLDVAVYNSLLKMCAEERLVEEAENILAGMVGRGLKPDSLTYKCVINLYAKEGRIKEAEKFAKRMVEVGISLDVVAYSCLMRACGVAKDFPRLESYFRKMLADGCIADDKCCGVLLSILVTCETEEDRATMQRCLLEANPVLGRIVDLLREEAVQPDELQVLLRNLVTNSHVGSQRPFCNALVDLCWKDGRRDRAKQLLALADSLNVYPGGLSTTSNDLGVLHLRSLSFSSALCLLDSWISHLREQVKQGKELPASLAVETGAGKHKVTRMLHVISSNLRDMGAPFEPSCDRVDWLTTSGSACKQWLESGMESEQLSLANPEFLPQQVPA